MSTSINVIISMKPCVLPEHPELHLASLRSLGVQASHQEQWGAGDA